MRHCYIVTYDICDPKRLRKVFNLCKGFGIHLQYSVFECDLNESERVEFERRLDAMIDDGEDQILFINLGPSHARGEKSITAIGKQYHKLDVPCYVV